MYHDHRIVLSCERGYVTQPNTIIATPTGSLLNTETDRQGLRIDLRRPHRRPNPHYVALPQNGTVFEITLLNDFVKYTFFDFPKMFTDCSRSDSNDLADVLQ